MNIHTICIHNGARGHELLFASQRWGDASMLRSRQEKKKKKKRELWRWQLMRSNSNLNTYTYIYIYIYVCVLSHRLSLPTVTQYTHMISKSFTVLVWNGCLIDNRSYLVFKRRISKRKYLTMSKKKATYHNCCF